METAESRRERRLAARAEREKQAAEGRRRATVRRRLLFGSIAVIVVGLLIAGFSIASRTFLQPAPGRTLPDEGRTHVSPGAPLDFKSNPPASGPHYSSWTRSGIYPEPQDPGNWVHSLEHGYVVVLYNCPDGCPEDVAALRQFYEDAPKSARYGYQKLIIQPDPSMSARFVAVAWARQDEMDALDVGRLMAFYRAFVDHGPEDAA